MVCSTLICDGLYVASWYVAPKALGYLTTRPELNGQLPTTFQVACLKMADMKSYLKGHIGEGFWIGIVQVLRDQGWLAAIGFLLCEPYFVYPPVEACILKKLCFRGQLAVLFWIFAIGAAFFRLLASKAIEAYYPSFGEFLVNDPIASGYKLYQYFKKGQSWHTSGNTPSNQPSLIPVEVSLKPSSQIQQILDLQSIDEFDRIPEIFQKDEVLRFLPCPISGLPIRYVVVITSTLQTEIPVYYEKTAINRWFEEHPGEFPPQWPLDLPLQRELLIVCLPWQSRINKRLDKLVSDLRAYNAARTDAY